MPFRSARQRRYLYARHPEIARRWSAEEKAVSKVQARFGPGGGGHGKRIVEDDVSKGVGSALSGFGSRVAGTARTTGTELKQTFRPFSARSKASAARGTGATPPSAFQQKATLFQNRAAETIKARPRAAGVIGGATLAGAGAGGYAVHKGEVSKKRREYDPEHRRQRRLGMYEAGLGAGGAGAAGYGGYRIVEDTKKLRTLPISGGKSGRTTLGETYSGKGALRVKRGPAALVGGGLLAVGGAGAVRHHAESSRGRIRG